MEYQVISANNPEAVVRRLNTQQGWELISITCEPAAAYGKQPNYCAFIRRARIGAAAASHCP
jgi:hypothetical protein